MSKGRGGSLRNVDGDEPIFVMSDTRSASDKEAERRRATINTVECGIRVNAETQEIRLVLEKLGLVEPRTTPPKRRRKH